MLDLHLYVWNDNYISLSKQNELQKNKTNSPDIFKQFLACFDTSNSYYVYNIMISMSQEFLNKHDGFWRHLLWHSVLGLP